MISIELQKFIEENTGLIERNTKESWEKLFDKSSGMRADLMDILQSAGIDSYQIFGENKDAYHYYDSTLLDPNFFLYVMDVSQYNIHYFTDEERAENKIGIEDFLHDKFNMNDFYGPYGEDPILSKLVFTLASSWEDDYYFYLCVKGMDSDGTVQGDFANVYSSQHRLVPKIMFENFIHVPDLKHKAMLLIQSIADEVKEYYSK